MNNIDTISNIRLVGGDYFVLKKLTKSKLYLKDFIGKFNFDDYWCFKKTNCQKLVYYNEFLKFAYSSYTFFKKSLYNKNSIQLWIDWFINLGGIQFLDKPTPPFHPNKIKIINE